MATAYSAMPDVVKDPATREAMEYVDAKVEKIMAPYESATSTATFSGWIDIGREIVTKRVSTIQADLSCPSDKVVMGGGCNTNDNTKTLVWSFPASANSWSCYASAAPANFDIYAICARIK